MSIRYKELTMIKLSQVKRELDIDNDTYDALVKWLITGVESIWDTLTNRLWADSSHTEILSGKGHKQLFLADYPVTGIDYISTSRKQALLVNNATEFAIATVSITSTGVSASYNGTSTSLTFATYPTIGELADAFTALGNGWSGEAASSLTDVASSFLLPVLGKSCSDGLDLEILSDFLSDFETDLNTGTIHSTGFVRGVNNIQVKYTAGYTEDTCPDWIKQILIRQVSHWYLQATEKRWHVSSMQLGDGGTIAYKNQKMNLLPEFHDLAGVHRRVNV